MEKFKCRYCGKKIDDVLCPYCGGRNSETFSVEQQEVDSKLNQSYQEDTINQENTENIPNSIKHIIRDNNGNEYTIRRSTSNKSYADISVICGIFSFVMFGLIFGPLAISFANKYIRSGDTAFLGKAKIGKALGIVGILFSLFPLLTIIPAILQMIAELG